MKLALIVISILCHIYGVMGQIPIAQQVNFNMELLSNRQIDFPTDISGQYQKYSDVWGFVSQDGTEYAIIGVGMGTAIYNLLDPENPTLDTIIPGTLSRWRDFKSHGNHIYAVADEGADGLLIIDMTEAPDRITWTNWQPSLQFGSDPSLPLAKCHNLYIDSTFVYLAGCNLNGGGVIILDISKDPQLPEVVSAGERRYAHDVFVQNNLMYTSDLSAGFALVDVSDRNVPQTLLMQETSSDFTHNAWASEDGRYLFTTDEKSSATIDAYDMSNLDDIVLLDRYRPLATLRSQVIPHNVHYQNGFLVISYYTDGVKIVDAHEPDNLVEVGSYDTYFDREDGFHGAWGAFPFLPSGLILVSDIETGLYVFKPTYERASYLRGTVRELGSDLLVEGATLEIVSELPSQTKTDGEGTFATGIAASGQMEVKIEKSGFRSKTVSVDLVPGQYVDLDIELERLEVFSVTGKVLDVESGLSIDGAQIIAYNDDYAERTVTDVNGNFILDAFEGEVVVATGSWGYIHSFEAFELNKDTSITFLVERGYRDDFTFDYGWSVKNEGASDSQGWQRGIPEYSIYNGEVSNPNGDLPDDFGKEAYVTGLAGSLGSNLGGTSILTSPFFDLSAYQDPHINYFIWFYDAGVSDSDDTLSVYLIDGLEEKLVELYTSSESGWRPRSEIRVAEYFAPSSQMRLKFVATDQGNVHIMEVGLDAFSVTEGQTTSLEDHAIPANVKVFPNPFAEVLSFEAQNLKVAQWSLHSADGKLIWKQHVDASEGSMDLQFLESGFYFLQLVDEDGRSTTRKVVKLR